MTATLDLAQRLIALASDYNYQQPTLAFADRQADLGGAPVYAYAFDWRSPARAGVRPLPRQRSFSSVQLSSAQLRPAQVSGGQWWSRRAASSRALTSSG